MSLAKKSLYKPNLCLFVPDLVSTVIDQNSITGWYVLFPPLIISTPVLIYHIQGDPTYYGYRSDPQENCATGNTDFDTGRCNLIWSSVEDAANSSYSDQVSDGVAENEQYGNGRFVLPKTYKLDNNRVFFGLFRLDDWFDLDVLSTRYQLQYGGTVADQDPVPSYFTDDVLVSTRLRFIPSSRIIKTDVFGTGIYYRWRVVESRYRPPVYSIDGTVITVGNLSDNPDQEQSNRFEISIVSGTELGLRLIEPLVFDLEVMIDLKGEWLDRVELIEPIEVSWSIKRDKLYMTLPAGFTDITVKLVSPIVGTYIDPVLICHPFADQVLSGWLV